MVRGENHISNSGRPTEYKYWMIGIVVFCLAGFLASIFPTFGTIIDYFWITLIVVGFITLVGYAVREYIKEKRFWSSKIGDKDYEW
jgi:uncharacterized membrane protein YjjP (DUF1212 family)